MYLLWHLGDTKYSRGLSFTAVDTSKMSEACVGELVEQFLLLLQEQVGMVGYVVEKNSCRNKKTLLYEHR
jgi:hypothetical protein